MINFPNAKINIGLKVTGKRPDNFHNIETVFYPIALSDALEVIINPESQQDEFTFSGIQIPGSGEDNICLKTLRLLREKCFVPFLKIHLHKVIPIGAGLGGGSSDAAFFIKLVDKVCGLNLSENEQLGFARKAGSDCAFFMANKPAFAVGRGDETYLMDLDLSAYYLVLLNPGIHISTAEAYAGVKPGDSGLDLRSETEGAKPASWKGKVENDFENAIFIKYPEIKDLKEELYRLGSIYASMSGSGSSVYGIFEREPDNVESIEKYIVWKGKL